jgi:hypothetical protein
MCLRRLIVLAALSLAVLAANSASAGPPSYLLLKRAPPEGHAGFYAAPAPGYAYGWFGASPQPMPQRHFGSFRSHIDWRVW